MKHKIIFLFFQVLINLFLRKQYQLSLIGASMDLRSECESSRTCSRFRMPGAARLVFKSAICDRRREISFIARNGPFRMPRGSWGKIFYCRVRREILRARAGYNESVPDGSR